MEKIGSDKLNLTRKVRPGCQLVERPYQDGEKWVYFDSKITDPDEMFSDYFWAKNRKHGLKGIMEEVLTGVLKEGRLCLFVDADGVTDDDRARLSAYRVLAREIGYEVGQYKFNPRSHNVSAMIWRKI